MKPLAGVRILTLESFGAAPYGTMMLADLGAEVIKIENPTSGGDASRSVGPNLLGDGDSQYFQSFTIELDAAMMQRTTEEWLARLTGAVPVAPIYSVRDAFSGSFMEETAMVTSVSHPAAAELRVLASPLKIDGKRPERTVCVPLGATNPHDLTKNDSWRKASA